MDHKLSRTGCERGEATPPLLGQLGGYCLSPGVPTKERELLGGKWGRLGVTQAGQREQGGSSYSELWLLNCIEMGDVLETLASSLLHPRLRPFPLTHPGIGPGLAQTVNYTH